MTPKPFPTVKYSRYGCSEGIVVMAAYIAFGAIHEMAHLLTANLVLFYLSPHQGDDQGNYDIFTWDNCFSIFIDRQVQVSTDGLNKKHEMITRHAGWIVSVLL